MYFFSVLLFYSTYLFCVVIFFSLFYFFCGIVVFFFLIYRSRAHFISSSLTLSGEEELEVKKRRDDAHTRHTKLRTELHSSKMVLQQLDKLTHNGKSGDC